MSFSPLFTSAPRLKLRVGGQVIAYAIGFNANVSVSVEPVYVIGEHGPVALEPTMYQVVTGALQILRLKSKTTLKNSANLAAAAAGGSPVTFNTATGDSVSSSGSQTADSTNSILTQQNLFNMLDPAQVLMTSTFDIDIYVRVPTATFVALPNATVVNATDTNPSLTEIKLMTVKDCRITSRNTNITMGTLVNEPVNFQGLLLVADQELAGDTTPIGKDTAIAQG